MGPTLHPNPVARPPARPPADAPPLRAAATPRLDETSEEGALTARGKSRRGRRTGHGGDDGESPRSGGFTIHIPNPLKMLSRRTSQHPDGLTPGKAKSTRNFQSITPPEGELNDVEAAEVAATAAAFVRTVSNTLEANGGIHEKHTTPPRAYTASSTISQLSRGSSSHVRLDDVTGGASAMVAAPVPAERLSQVVPSEGAPLDSDESSGIERTMTMSV